MFNVLVIEKVHDAGLEIIRNAPNLTLIEGWTLSPEEWERMLPTVDAMLVRISPVPAEMINAAPNLKVIAKHGVGCDNIDLETCRARGITVAIAADANASSVAEHTLMMILGLAKNLGTMDGAVRRDYSKRMTTRVVDVAGRRILVLGYGRIGKLVAPLCRAFGMEVVLHDKLLQSATCDGYEVAQTLADGLDGADFLTVHVPLTPETKGFVGREELSRMNPGAFVVNCARGGIVDEAALRDLMETGHLGGVASDVFSAEPILPDNPILEIEGSLLTPHSAALSEESVRRMATRAASNIRDCLNGELPPDMKFPL